MLIVTIVAHGNKKSGLLDYSNFSHDQSKKKKRILNTEMSDAEDIFGSSFLPVNHGTAEVLLKPGLL